MNWSIVEENWKQYKGKVMAHWGKLNDNYLDKIADKRDQLAGKVKKCME